jgi:hypothetical protein
VNLDTFACKAWQRPVLKKWTEKGAVYMHGDCSPLTTAGAVLAAGWLIVALDPTDDGITARCSCCNHLIFEEDDE